MVTMPAAKPKLTEGFKLDKLGRGALDIFVGYELSDMEDILSKNFRR